MPSFTKTIAVAAAAFVANAAAALVEARSDAYTPTYTAPAGHKKFQLMVLPIGQGSDSIDYEGMFVTTFHTVAAQAVTTLTYNQTEVHME